MSQLGPKATPPKEDNSPSKHVQRNALCRSSHGQTVLLYQLKGVKISLTSSTKVD